MSERSRALWLAAAISTAVCGAPRVAPAAEPVSAAALYAAECAYCHGERGGGDGQAAGMLKPPPTVFSSAEYWKTADKKKMAETIANGKAGTAMMPFGNRLSPEQIAALVEYLATFAK